MSWYVMMCLTCASRTTGSACWSRMESSLSDGRIISGQLFTAFDEETKGTRVMAALALFGACVLVSCFFRWKWGGDRVGFTQSYETEKYSKTCSNLAAKSDLGWTQGPSERYYGILTSKGEIKNDHSCASNATETWIVYIEELARQLCIK